MCYIMKCEWLKNESSYFVTCKVLSSYFATCKVLSSYFVTCKVLSSYFVTCKVLSVDPATSSDCYKCEVTSVLAAIFSCSSSHYLTLYFQNMFNKL